MLKTSIRCQEQEKILLWDVSFATVRNMVLLITDRCWQDIWLAREAEDGFDAEDMEIYSRFI